ncbi:MAG: hypothetical protein JNL78_13300 [Rhodocyclaceae bacterium]|jgi:hypothetical protein|nr:hypothetical protein [Rhodocyclaceae bacterium]
MTRDIPPALRLPLLILGFASLIVGVGAGLLRLGWAVPRPAADLAAFHGPLMVCGFFGTVIALERAVALGRGWAYFGPLSAGAGGLALILGAPLGAAQALLALGSAVLLAGSASVFLRQRALFTFTLAAGAASWLAGNLLWLAGLSVHQAVPWWIGFLVLTIAGERLELSRFLPPSPTAQRIFVAVLAGQTFGMALSAHLLGAALLALAAWLLRQDIARRTVKESGLTRFIAVCLLSGYVWLALAGAIMLAAGLAPGSFAYDAALHALMLGFVFSMVFGHAPIIFPAVLRVAVPYHPGFYAPLALLHLSLLLRLAGDAADAPGWRSLGGLLNAAALALFILGTIAAVVRGRLRKAAGNRRS